MKQLQYKYVERIVTYASDHHYQLLINKLQKPFLRTNDLLVYQAILKTPHHTCYGYKIGFDEEVRNIAVFEAYERYCFYRWKKINGDENATSVGTASHITKNLAIKHALCELIEKDQILTFFNKSQKAFKIDDFSSKIFRNTKSILNAFDYDIRIYLISPKEQNCCTFAAAITSQNERYPFFFMGSSCGLSAHESINQAIEEAFVKWVFDFFAIEAGRRLNASGIHSYRKFYHHKNHEHLRRYFSTEALSFEALKSHALDHNDLSNFGEDVHIENISPPDEQGLPICIRLRSPQLKAYRIAEKMRGKHDDHYLPL